ncbi:F0F1 ATP synthase subunit B family protein [Asticcacaulis taihuensis]|uniref:ATP synthase subunit b n=1 Tax=Asticcacaulis taihuensis TaxID=260084 RepID=A0A1G4Q882_9CAUL|nr:ATP F0F1 synthase subunit B [Asticcacaulis taihuensis]SCW40692.1 F-type H+-transporting ATPase subunit b [Asticcacaulis taihuensis]
MEMLTEAEFWVRAALVLFFLILFVAKVPGKLWTSLGDTGKAVRAELDEAVRIRQEATDLLNSIKAQRLASEAKARELIAFAEEEAARMAAEARVKLEETIRRREALAERKIAQTEANATADVKSTAADLAAQLAEQILLDQVAKAKTDTQVDKAIGQLEGRFN